MTLAKLIELPEDTLSGKYARIPLQDGSDKSSQSSEYLFVKIKTSKLVLNAQDCILIQFQNLSQLRKILQLQAENKTIQMMAQTLTHDVLTPLNCANQILESIQTKKSSFDMRDIDIIKQTTEMVIGQIKASLDFNLAEIGMFKPQLRAHLLIKDVVSPVLEIFKV